MKGGHAHNVIPESVTFGGTFRSLTTEGFSYLKKRIKEVNNGTITPLSPFHLKPGKASVCSRDQPKFLFL